MTQGSGNAHHTARLRKYCYKPQDRGQITCDEADLVPLPGFTLSYVYDNTKKAERGPPPPAICIPLLFGNHKSALNDQIEVDRNMFFLFPNIELTSNLSSLIVEMWKWHQTATWTIEPDRIFLMVK